MRKPVVLIVVALALVGAGIGGWKWWSDSQRRALYAEWRQQLRDDAKRDQVIQSLRESLKSEPGLADAHALLGEALVSAGKFSDAAIELREGARLAPGDVAVRRTLAQLCMKLNLVDEAMRVLNDALAHSDEGERPAVELELGQVCLERYRGSAKEEDFRAARNYFQDARHHPDTEAEAIDGYAALWLTKGSNFDLDKGIAAYRELLTKFPNYWHADKIRELLDNFDHRASRPDAAAPPSDPPPPKKDGAG